MVYINDTYKFIFIDNPKSGSTSVTNALRESLGTPVARGSPKEVHLTCDEIKKQWPEKWATYFKVTTYRDPFRRFCSSANYGSHYFNNYSNVEELKAHFIDNRKTCVYCMPQEEFTKECDFLIRLDNMQKDFNEFCEKIGIDPVTVGKSNKKDTTRKFFNLESVFKELV